MEKQMKEMEYYEEMASNICKELEYLQSGSTNEVYTDIIQYLEDDFNWVKAIEFSADNNKFESEKLINKLIQILVDKIQS